MNPETSFFRNMSPLSPVLDDFYSDHENHYHLITREPMLCCMILTISSRYHTLPAAGGQIRGHLIHQRLWEHCQQLLLRIMLGQEKSSKAKTRTLGSVEALLLLAEWHPRALHVPPAGDGWDSDPLLSMPDERDDRNAVVENPSRSRWREDVINPSRRSDQMTWMMLSCASSLATEIGIFNLDDDGRGEDLGVYKQRLLARRLPITKLLYLFQEQLASRLGCKPMLPEGMSHAMSRMRPMTRGLAKEGEDWNTFANAWIELTKLERSISDVMFPSPVVTRHLLDTGRYVSVIEHFRPLLSNWEGRYLSSACRSPPFRIACDSFAYPTRDLPPSLLSLVPTTPLRDIMLVEYQSTKIYTNSLGLQIIAERAMADSNAEGPVDGQFDMNSTDYGFVQAVMDACLATLRVAVRAARDGRLHFAPVRLFLRVTTASVFLLKALGLGVSTTRLRDALALLARATAALRTCRPDDLHLGPRYATLLEMYVDRLRDKFIPATRPPFFATMHPPSIPGGQGLPDGSEAEQVGAGRVGWQMEQLDETGLQGMDSTARENGPRGALDEPWLSLPPEPSLQPFLQNESLGFEWLSQNSLDFIWNMEL